MVKVLCWLEKELERDLPDTRGPRANHVSKRRIGELPIRIIKLGVIEDVEEFKPQFNRLRFRQGNLLAQGHIPVVDARPIKKSPRGVAH